MELSKNIATSAVSPFVRDRAQAPGARTGRTLGARDFGDLMQLGFIAQLCLSARDVDQALTCACLYSPLWSRRDFRCERGPDRDVWVRTQGLDHEDAARFDVVAVIATWCKLVAEVSGFPMAPVAVHAPARARAVLRELLGCPIHESEHEVALRFAPADVARANPAADDRLFSLLETLAAQRLADVVESQSTRERLRCLLAQQTDVSEVRAERIGRELGIGVRTLHRRLKAEGTSFRKVVDEFRQEHGLRQLASSRASAKEVAYALGFSDPASFHRAFKRWTGSTVRAYREAVKAPSSAETLEAKAS